MTTKRQVVSSKRPAIPKSTLTPAPVRLEEANEVKRHWLDVIGGLLGNHFFHRCNDDHNVM
jgi:hypothetical protein